MTTTLPSTFLFDGMPDSAEPLAMREKRERQMAVWLDAVGASGWRGACDAAGVGDAQVLRWMRMHPDFAERHRATSAETALRLETIVDAIATGEVDATPAQVTLLQFRLKGLRPEVYRERASVQVDQRTTLSAEAGEGGRARLLLAEWQS
jgi:hypothetical protein